MRQWSRARDKAPLHTCGNRSAAAQQRSASQECGAGREQNRLQAATPRVAARALFARQMRPARHSTRLERRKRVKRRTVCAPVCRTARSGACAGLSAQARPVSSRTTPAADNGASCTTEQALAAFDSAARRASTHSSRRRCGVLGSQTPAKRRDAQPHNEEVQCSPRFVDWTQRGAHWPSASTRRSAAALTACSPRSPAGHDAQLARVVPVAVSASQRSAGAAHGRAGRTARKHQLQSERTSPRAPGARR